MTDMDDFYDVKVMGQELSDDELKRIQYALLQDSSHWSKLADDDDYLSRRADREIRINKAHYYSHYENDPEGSDYNIYWSKLHEFLKGEIRRDCRSESKELQRLSKLFFEVCCERKGVID